MQPDEIMTLINSDPSNLPVFFENATGISEQSDLPSFGVIRDQFELKIFKLAEYVFGKKEDDDDLVSYKYSKDLKIEKSEERSMLRSSSDEKDQKPIQLSYIKFKYCFTEGSHKCMDFLIALKHSNYWEIWPRRSSTIISKIY